MKKIIYIITSISIFSIIFIFLSYQTLCAFTTKSDLGNYLSLNTSCKLDFGTLLTSIISISIGIIITTLIFWYQEKQQEQRQIALINIDLLSKNTFDKKCLNRQAILYGTLYGFMDLLNSLEDNSFTDKLCKLRKFVNKYLSNDLVETEAKNY